MTERPNIRRMQIPESTGAEAGPFDVSRDISPTLWNRLQKDMAEAWASNPGVDSSRPWDALRAAEMKILDPGKLPPLTERDWARVLITFEKNRTDSFSAHSMIHNAIPIMILDPKRKPSLTAKEKVLTINSAKSMDSLEPLQRGDYGYIRDLTIFDANLIPPGIAEVFVQDIESHLIADRNTNNYESFASICAAVRFIAPEYQLEITDEDWKHMRRLWKAMTEPEELQKISAHGTLSVVQFAADMKVAAAEKVEVTRDGVYISPPKKRRKFAEKTEPPQSLAI